MAKRMSNLNECLLQHSSWSTAVHIYTVSTHCCECVYGNVFVVLVTVHRDKFLIIKPTRCTNLSKFMFGIKLYMFRTVPLSIIRSFSYTQQWYMSYKFADSLRCQQICMTYTTACAVSKPV